MKAILAFLALLLFAAPAMGEDAAPEIHVVILHHPGPAWDKTRGFREQAGVEGHIAHYRALLEKGDLAMGGPFLDDTGGMMVSKAGADLATLTAYANDDPAVKSGLLIVEVHPWMVAMHAD